ncbi:hypothetical protein RND81_14G205500 [Saponaria officinalis]|uniref:F-box domain-containing protein n=1 Tax=Saponaria officinalis TaxID=3572 RepID=A0AAW1GPB1_SAPOF
METSIILPEHVIEDILLRLPVKHLLPWKSVSKYFYALIRDEHFAKKHYHFQYAMHLVDHGDVPLLLDTPSDHHVSAEFHLVSAHGGRDVIVNITPDFERDIPPVIVLEGELYNQCMRCIGLVNGIVCLLWGRGRLALWNPATREFKGVPRWPIMPDDKDAEKLSPSILGFGFDVQSNDFKILGIIRTINRNALESDCIYEFHVYSLKANSWKMIKDIPRTYLAFDLAFTDSYFNNGVHYWPASELPYIPRNGIVSFNFSSETFKEFEPPVAAVPVETRCRLKVGKYKEGLALLVNRTSENEETCFEIWAATEFRDDNEVPSCWQLVVNVPPIYSYNTLNVCSIIGCGDLLLHICVHDDDDDDDDDDEEWGDVRFADSGAYLYNLSTRTFKYFGFRFNSSFRYVESLFPLSRRLL